MANFEESIQLLVDMGLYDVVLPFIFVFTIIYAVLQKISIFGKDKKNIDSLIALVFGFVVVASLNVVNIINEMMSLTALLMVGSVMVLVLLGAFGVKTDSPWVKKASMILALLGSVIIVGSVTGLFEKIDIPTGWIKASSGVVLSFAFFIVVIWWIVRDTSDKGKSEKKSKKKSGGSSGGGDKQTTSKPSGQTFSPSQKRDIYPDDFEER